MTSGNLAGEPIVTDDDDALAGSPGSPTPGSRTTGRSTCPCDDSVTRAVGGIESPVRRSRGQAPLPLGLPFETPPALAVGGDLKNTFCLAEGRLAWMSGHVGDMDDLADADARSTAAEAAPRDAHRRRARRRRRRPSPGVPLAPVGPRPRSAADPSRRSSTTTPTSPATMAEHGVPTDGRCSGSPSTAPATATTAPSWGGEFLVADYRVVRAGGAPRVRRPSRRRRRRPQPVPDGALPPAQRGVDWDARAAQRARLRRHRARPARPPARDRPALRADVQHGPALRRSRLDRRHLPSRRVRRPGRDGARGARPPVGFGAGRPATRSARTSTRPPCGRGGRRRAGRRSEPGLVAARFQQGVVDLVVARSWRGCASRPA